MIDRRRFLQAAAAVPLILSLPARAAASKHGVPHAAVAVLPSIYRFSTRIALTDAAAPAMLTIPILAATPDRLRTLDFVWLAAGGRADFTGDPGAGTWQARLVWPGDKRGRSAAITQTVFLPPDCTDRNQRLQAAIDRIAEKSAADPASCRIRLLGTALAPPLVIPKPPARQRRGGGKPLPRSPAPRSSRH